MQPQCRLRGPHLTVDPALPTPFGPILQEAERLVFSNRRVNTEGEMLGMNIGDVVTGVVQSVRPYGAFIDIGGATGLLHISQITHERLTAVDQIMQVRGRAGGSRAGEGRAGGGRAGAWRDACACGGQSLGGWGVEL